MNSKRLAAENVRFANTPGISNGCSGQGFAPAFLNRATGEARISCSADGRPMPIHVLDGVPEAWVVHRNGPRVISVLDSIVSGFQRDGQFFTREEVAAMKAESAAQR